MGFKGTRRVLTVFHSKAFVAWFLAVFPPGRGSSQPQGSEGGGRDFYFVVSNPLLAIATSLTMDPYIVIITCATPKNQGWLSAHPVQSLTYEENDAPNHGTLHDPRRIPSVVSEGRLVVAGGFDW